MTDGWRGLRSKSGFISVSFYICFGFVSSAWSAPAPTGTSDHTVSAKVMTGNIKFTARSDCDYQLEKKTKRVCRGRSSEPIGQATYKHRKYKGDNWTDCSLKVRCLGHREAKEKRAAQMKKARPRRIAKSVNQGLEVIFALILASFVLLPMAIRGWSNFQHFRDDGLSGGLLVLGPGLDLGISVLGLYMAFYMPGWFPFFAIVVLPLTPTDTLSGMPLIGSFFRDAEDYIDLLRGNPDQASKLIADRWFREEEDELLQRLVLGAISLGVLQSGIIMVGSAVTAAGGGDWMMPVLRTVVITGVGIVIIRFITKLLMTYIGIFLVGIPLWFGFRLSVAVEKLRDQ